MKDLRENSSHDLWLHVLNDEELRRLFIDYQYEKLMIRVGEEFDYTMEQLNTLKDKYFEVRR